ncbi:hypothetical protein EYF80_047585 [Liparis tanakae]|uniref:Transmembrane protein n=1 Tax=Liparis tanakae TaxID=230148 RepID=A0A4Z2FMX2_9TELE|nr:hypothetical protein EYF80_047585 [Liparis tanakae]
MDASSCRVASKALGLFSRRRTITLTASASDRARLDRPDSSSFSFTSVFSVRHETRRAIQHIALWLEDRGRCLSLNGSRSSLDLDLHLDLDLGGGGAGLFACSQRLLRFATDRLRAVHFRLLGGSCGGGCCGGCCGGGLGGFFILLLSLSDTSRRLSDWRRFLLYLRSGAVGTISSIEITKILFGLCSPFPSYPSSSSSSSSSSAGTLLLLALLLLILLSGLWLGRRQLQVAFLPGHNLIVGGFLHEEPEEEEHEGNDQRRGQDQQPEHQNEPRGQSPLGPLAPRNPAARLAEPPGPGAEDRERTPDKHRAQEAAQTVLEDEAVQNSCDTYD